MAKSIVNIDVQILDDKDIKRMIVGILLEHYGEDFVMDNLKQTEDVKEEIFRVVKKYMKVTSNS